MFRALGCPHHRWGQTLRPCSPNHGRSEGMRVPSQPPVSDHMCMSDTLGWGRRRRWPAGSVLRRS